ncbi:succinate dehydrogenase, hydrophobic membrane anchor protein [Coralloluteibacterium stylophorae]|uniref:Succinate dehydrogenase hydrophobic membrane anchor subunit n=1 Tax=Coralloluteibacterium stylophorae TaxID=1776034 RepID=A0A8J7VTH4_9GAMM|nr:succinate dehydrogenase, hydrophobic membrane anchor protein [Coralloluteibacterium stylophorae]MBS7455826.1 succinate dehydrogenase, hydrophobic membrane anchor protein [Coralloluteibacterium stylophorae]
MSGHQPSMRDPLARARGIGASGSGVSHWWIQRISSVALALLTPWFVWLVIASAGADQASVRAMLAQPVHATLMLGFVIALFWHTKLGLQVVIEDYVHTRWVELALLALVDFVCILATLACVLAVGRMVFTA